MPRFLIIALLQAPLRDFFFFFLVYDSDATPYVTFCLVEHSHCADYSFVCLIYG